ncbi:cytochrome P450 [Streptomyces sp. M10(2022)]
MRRSLDPRQTDRCPHRNVCTDQRSRGESPLRRRTGPTRRRTHPPVTAGIHPGHGTKSGLPSRLAGPAAHPANRRFDTARRELRSLVESLVRTHAQDTFDRGDVLSRLIAARDPDSGQPMDPDQIRDEAMTFLTAGIETVSTTLTWLYHELAQHPGVQKCLHAEIDEVLGSRPVTYDDLPQLPYTQSVVRETLRLHSPAWMLMRRPAAPTVLGGVTFPAGAELLCSPATIHRDPALYPQPMHFAPDRWLSADACGPAFLPSAPAPTVPGRALRPHRTRYHGGNHQRPLAAHSYNHARPREIAGAALSPDRLAMTARRRTP